jgi:hypothetical protein
LGSSPYIASAHSGITFYDNGFSGMDFTRDSIDIPSSEGRCLVEQWKLSKARRKMMLVEIELKLNERITRR